MSRQGAADAAAATFGQTIDDLLRAFAGLGYRASMHIDDDGDIACGACGRASEAARVPLDHVGRVEGVSDPADEDIVLAVRCPACDARGVLVTYYGTGLAPEHVEAVRALGTAAGDR